MCEFHEMVHMEAAVSSSPLLSAHTHIHGHSPPPACCAGSAFCPRLHPAPMDPSHCSDLTLLVAGNKFPHDLTSLLLCDHPPPPSPRRPELAAQQAVLVADAIVHMQVVRGKPTGTQGRWGPACMHAVIGGADTCTRIDSPAWSTDCTMEE